MNLVARIFRRKSRLKEEDLIKPFCTYARQAAEKDDWAKAIAHLDRGIQLAPETLDLYLQRAHIFQYGLKNYPRALEDYRHILSRLERMPDEHLKNQCKEGMRDMMTMALTPPRQLPWKN